MSDEPTYNPEAGMPVHPDNDWHVPELIGRMWFAGEIQAALANYGFTPEAFDPNVLEPCPCSDSYSPGFRAVVKTAEDCACNGTGQVPITLHRGRRWVKGGLALRVPLRPDDIVSPYLAACVVALFAG